MVRRYWKVGCAFLIMILALLKKKPSIDTIVDERLNEIPDKQVPRIKRRLQESRDRQAREEKQVAE